MKRRQKEGKKLFPAIFSWLVFLGFISLFPPSGLPSYAIFYFLLSTSLLISFRLIISISRSIIWLTIILIYLFLRQNHLDNLINTMLLLGIFITLEIYFRKT